jgi:hypothetical protein
MLVFKATYEEHWPGVQQFDYSNQGYTFDAERFASRNSEPRGFLTGVPSVGVPHIGSRGFVSAVPSTKVHVGSPRMF